jgi:hypothetical protein
VSARGAARAVAIAAGFLFAAAVPAAAQTAQQPSAPPLPTDASSLGWMAGCWEMRSGARLTQEEWMPPAGGAMLGMSRTLLGDRLREFEFVFLGPVDGRLAFVAKPSGQQGATFPVESSGDGVVAFAQAAHDFPQRITYRRLGADSLLAFIEGPTEGGQLRIDFRYARVRCAGP